MADLGLELTRDHQQRQIRNAAGVAAAVVELCNRHRKGQMSDKELITALVGADAVGFESATSMASGYMVQHRALVARALVDAPLVVPEFDAAASSARAVSTLKALQRLRSAELPQHIVDREFRAITGNLGVWVDKATKMASRDLIVESAGYAGSRWRRVTDGNPCAFCAMLAGRGPVYLTRESAGRVVGREMGRGTKQHRSTGKVSYDTGDRFHRKRGTRDIGERYHDRCGCTVEEIAGDWSPSTSEQKFVNLYEQAVERLDAHGLPHTVGNITNAMRDLGRGVIHDAHMPETQGGGRSVPRSASQPNDDGRPNWRGLVGKPPSGPAGKVLGLAETPVERHELQAFTRLAAYGANVRVFPVSRRAGAKNPDIEIAGEMWEVKSPIGASEKNTISDQFKRARKQGVNFVLDLSRCGLPDEVAIAQAVRRFKGQDRIRKMIVLDHSGAVAYYGELA